jgi:hypothetical protein
MSDIAMNLGEMETAQVNSGNGMEQKLTFFCSLEIKLEAEIHIDLLMRRLRATARQTIVSVALDLAEAHKLALFDQAILSATPQRQDRVIGSPVTPLIRHIHGRLPLAE